MSIIRLKEANCKNCYKCIRECPVKSISYKNEQAGIIDRDCILCGHCLLSCPQHAKEIVSDVEKVKGFLRGKNKVYVSLAPSFSSFFPQARFGAVASALKKLGFTHVEETAVGASKVSAEYEKLLSSRKMPNIITTACPTVVLLVEKYYPSLIPFLAPVRSPLLAHAKSMREVYGSKIKVVFIGPCIAKKHEADDVVNDNAVSAALTFEELADWMREEGVEFDDTAEEQRAIENTSARFYPMPGGILKTIPASSRRYYKCISVDGLDRCVDTLKALRDGGLTNYFIEMNSCVGACLGGHSMQFAGLNYFGCRENLVLNAGKPVNGPRYMTDELDIGIHKEYLDRSSAEAEPTEEDIRKILTGIGKTRPEDELDCGGCGYKSCREKAIAVFHGKADPQMCLPYMKERAVSVSNLIIDNSPNAILALDESLHIQEINREALRMLNMPRDGLIGRHIEEILPSELYDRAIRSGQPVKEVKQQYESLHLIVEQSVIFVREQNIFVVLLKNITEEEERKQKSAQIRDDTINIAQKVIDKQMRVAQEIASLLGETTAETKIALTRLKGSVRDEAGGGTP